MQRLIALAVALSLSFAALLLAVIAVQRGNALAQVIPHLERCGEKPCLAGVIPTETNWVKGQELLLGIEGIRRSPAHTSFVKLGLSPLRIQAFVESDTIRSLMVEVLDAHAPKGSLSAGNLISYWGAPCAAVSISPTAIALIYPKMSVLATRTAADQTLDPRSCLSQVNLFDRFDSCASLPPSLADQKWRGFTVYR